MSRVYEAMPLFQKSTHTHTTQIDAPRIAGSASDLEAWHDLRPSTLYDIRIPRVTDSSLCSWFPPLVVPGLDSSKLTTNTG